jgi:hypothetical protein
MYGAEDWSIHFRINPVQVECTKTIYKNKDSSCKVLG